MEMDFLHCDIILSAQALAALLLDVDFRRYAEELLTFIELDLL